MSSEIFSWVYIIASFQGLFLAFLIGVLDKRGSKTARLLLSVLLLLFSMHLLSYGFAYAKNIQLLVPLWEFSGTLVVLFGPLIYLYVRTLLTDQKFKALELLHLLPFIILNLWHLDYYLLDTAAKEAVVSYWLEADNSIKPSLSFVVISLFEIILLLTYLILTVRLYKNWQCGSNKNRQSNPQNAWILKLIIGFAVYLISFTGHKLILLLGYSYYDFICHLTKLGMGISLYGIGYLGYAHPQILSARIEAGRYKNSPVTKSFSISLADRLKELMIKDKLFLRDDMSLEFLAKAVDLPTHYVSQVINEEIGQTFSDFINSFRIEEAKNLLLNYPKKKIIEIGYDSGFKSKVTFNVVFKQMVSCSPSEYRKSHTKSFSI